MLSRSTHMTPLGPPWFSGLPEAPGETVERPWLGAGLGMRSGVWNGADSLTSPNLSVYMCETRMITSGAVLRTEISMSGTNWRPEPLPTTNQAKEILGRTVSPGKHFLIMAVLWDSCGSSRPLNPHFGWRPFSPSTPLSLPALDWGSGLFHPPGDSSLELRLPPSRCLALPRQEHRLWSILLFPPAQPRSLGGGRLDGCEAPTGDAHGPGALGHSHRALRAARAAQGAPSSVAQTWSGLDATHPASAFGQGAAAQKGPGCVPLRMAV